MKKLTTLFFALVMIKAGMAQVNFENLTFSGKDYWIGTAGVPGDYPFTAFYASFTLRNDTSAFGDYWSGWAYSKLKDSISLSYDTSECAAFPAMGNGGSNNYAVAYYSFNEYYNHIRFNVWPISTIITGLYITNTTITYRSMQNGDPFAKNFGGVSGNDPDYYRIKFTGWYNGIPKIDTVTFYLADFRDANNANDYIVNSWEWVNLSILGQVDSLTYTLESTDTNAFGMNTPAYFCIDDLQANGDGVEENILSAEVKIYPNPFTDILRVQNNSRYNADFELTDLNGSIVRQFKLEATESKNLNTGKLARGIYILKIEKNNATYYKKLLKSE